MPVIAGGKGVMVAGSIVVARCDARLCWPFLALLFVQAMIFLRHPRPLKIDDPISGSIGAAPALAVANLMASRK